MKTPLTFLLALTFLFLFSGSVYGGDLEDGWDAYQKQDYKTAHRLWLPLAEQGNAEAETKARSAKIGLWADKDPVAP